MVIENNRYPLPEYLGFGILDHYSVVRTEKRVYATYTSYGDKVFDLDWSDQSCLLSEYYLGEKISTCVSDSLKDSFFINILAANPLKHPRFVQLMKTVTAFRNVQFAPPDKQAYLFYPAGLIYTLRQPIFDCNSQAWLELKSMLIKNKGFLPLSFETERKGLIFRIMGDDDTISEEQVSIVELSCRLIDLTKAVEICFRSGFIPSGVCPMMIASEPADSSLEIFTKDEGNIEMDCKALAVYEFGSENKLTHNEAINIFKKFVGFSQLEIC